MDNKTTPPIKKPPWYRSTGGIVALLFLAGVCIFLLVKKGCGEMDKSIFTEYGPLQLEETPNYFGVDTIGADSTLLSDSASVVISTEPTDKRESRPTEKPKDNTEKDSSSLVDLFKVNTTFDKISPSEAAGNNPSTSNKIIPSDRGLFEELLIAQNHSQEEKALFDNYYREKILSSKSVLKLLSISGKHLLLANSQFDYQSILEVLTDAEEVQGILIVDRNERIVFATNQKYINAAIVQVFPQLDLGASTITWYQSEEQNVAVLPLFHTYGRIGTAVLITALKKGN